jgi:hypothetical protein
LASVVSVADDDEIKDLGDWENRGLAVVICRLYARHQNQHRMTSLLIKSYVFSGLKCCEYRLSTDHVSGEIVAVFFWNRKILKQAFL